jgi:hypothetical protein
MVTRDVVCATLNIYTDAIKDKYLGLPPIVGMYWTWCIDCVVENDRLAKYSSYFLVFIPLWLGRDDRIITETHNHVKFSGSCGFLTLSTANFFCNDVKRGGI